MGTLGRHDGVLEVDGGVGQASVNILNATEHTPSNSSRGVFYDLCKN